MFSNGRKVPGSKRNTNASRLDPESLHRAVALQPLARGDSSSSANLDEPQDTLIEHLEGVGLEIPHGRTVEYAGAAAADSASNRPSEMYDRNLDSSQTEPFLIPKGRPGPTSYGSASNTASQTASPTDSDAETEHAHPSQHEARTNLSLSRRAGVAGGKPVKARQLKDRVVLVTGLEGRLGITDAPLPRDVLEDAKQIDPEADASDDGTHGEVEDEIPPENSPHEAVRASVSPIDNTTLSINTPRMWILSVLFSILGSSTNLFFSLRYPSVAITPVIALLLVHPLGLLWDYFLKRHDDPVEEFVDGIRTRSMMDAAGERPPPRSRSEQWRLWLAQGRWNEKEHTCVYVSSNIAFGFAFATDVIVEQSMFYGQDVSVTYQLLLTLSTQMLGYTFAGLTRRFLVRPSGMIWPGTLMSAAMFTTLHKEENAPANGWTITRWKFFYVVWSVAFLFYFLPGLLFPALSYFNVITWFAPKSVVVANLFGVVSGLGLFPLTFDWAQITYIGSPLLVPFWAAMNVIGGLVIVMWVVAPIAYYGNMFYSSYMPILSASVFDNTGKVYDVSKILTPNFLFDREAYHQYSRVFLPITYVLSYGVQFAAIAALLTHTACWYGKDIWATWQMALQEARDGDKPTYQPVSGSDAFSPDTPISEAFNGPPRRASSSLEGMLGKEDIHSRLMKRYKDAPITWYMLTFVSMTAIGIFVVE